MRRNWNELPTESLLKLLNDANNPIDVCATICELVKRNVQSAELKQILIRLKEKYTSFWNNYLISDFALAALHILEIEKYEGERKEVLDLISSGLQFNLNA